MKSSAFLRFGVHAAEAGWVIKGCTLDDPAKLDGSIKLPKEGKKGSLFEGAVSEAD